MGEPLENRLENLLHEISEIRKELILQKSYKPSRQKASISTWRSLGKEISSKWDNVSAVDEISRQRTKP